MPVSVASVAVALGGGRLGGRAAVRAVHPHGEEVGLPGRHRRGHVELVGGQPAHGLGLDQLGTGGEDERRLVAPGVGGAAPELVGELLRAARGG